MSNTINYKKAGASNSVTENFDKANAITIVPENDETVVIVDFNGTRYEFVGNRPPRAI